MGLTPRLTSETDTPTQPFMIAGVEGATIIQVKLVSTTVDAGSTGQTHKLRAGLTLAMVTAGDDAGKWIDYAHSAVTGADTAMGFLVNPVNMKDESGTAVDSWAIVVIGGQPLIDESFIYGEDSDVLTSDLVNKFLWSSSYEI